ncbi:MAG TPA: cupredoxin domain-containing protein [Acidimicrobiia bacterium]|nr:cupredoxin domain-containing protein [Acidimicrobiia bacterium]
MRRAVRSSLVVIAAVVFVLGVVGCSSSSHSKAASGATSESTTPAATGTTIAIKNFEYSPNPLKVKVGATVTVRNTDSTDHTVTADKGSFDTGHIHGGGTATFTVTKAGTYPYHCDIHQFMKGVLEVTG